MIKHMSRLLHRKPKSGLLRTNKDMRVNNSPPSVMNLQLDNCLLNDGLTPENGTSVLIAMMIMDAEKRLMYLKTKERYFGKC